MQPAPESGWFELPSRTIAISVGWAVSSRKEPAEPGSTDRSMKIRLAVGCLAFGALLSAQTVSSQTAPTPTAQVVDAATERALLNQYCVTCHNQKLKTADLELDKLDTAHVADHADKWELVVRKLRAGMMPPSGLPRPNWATYESMVT
jgi:hypothetical protein